jgi:hypothetical protein
MTNSFLVTNDKYSFAQVPQLLLSGYTDTIIIAPV